MRPVNNPENLLGIGIYSVPEAARITAVPAPTIRRWIRGYSHKAIDAAKDSPPLWRSDFERAEADGLELSFRDLMEVRFISAFRKLGVSWPKLRIAAENASEVLRTSHPFSTKKFKTDGRSIFVEIAEKTGDKNLLDLVKRQYNIHSVVDPHLFTGLQFDGHGAVERWFPMYPNKRIVIDPAIAFGRPVTSREHVPVSAIASLARVEPASVVARWFEVSKQSVAAAVEYQKQLAA